MSASKAIPGSRCRMIGCDYEAAYSDPNVNRRFLNEHLSTAHGVGSKGADAHVGCVYSECKFEVSGSVKFTQDEFRAHLVAIHGVNPENPEIPAEKRSGRWV